LVGNVFFESPDVYVHLNFNQAGVNDTQSCIAYGISCLHHLNPRLHRDPKTTYILSPQQGTMVEVSASGPPAEMEKFLLQSVARKLSIDRTHLEIAFERIGIPTAGVRQRVSGTGEKKKKGASTTKRKKRTSPSTNHTITTFFPTVKEKKKSRRTSRKSRLIHQPYPTGSAKRVIIPCPS
jgi:hypothetical protein